MDFKALQAKIDNQEACKKAVRTAGYKAAFLSTVGSGKGKIFIDLAEELLKAGKIQTILYLCDNTRLRDSQDGFPGELEKWGSPELAKIVTLECYQTVYKWKDRHFDLVIADEVDYAITPAYVKFFQNNKWNFIIMASGTLTPEKRKILVTLAPIVFKLSMVDAEDRGVVNKTDYYMYQFKMTESESRQYSSMTAKIGALLRAEVAYDDPEMTFWLRKRKHFLNELDSSYLHCRKVMQYFYNQNKSNRIVVFCELTGQADRVCRYSYHGGNEESDNLNKFQSGEVNAISVVSKIQRGINLKNANIAIFESMSGSTTRFEQKGGRMKRLAVDQVARVVFMVPWYCSKGANGELVWKPTVVKNWIEKATGNIPNIHFNNLKL
jgi:superfamily II DNA or RNA helicase